MGEFSPAGADFLVLAICAISGLLAASRGFVREVLAAFSWIGAAVATFYFYPQAQAYAQDLIGDRMLANAASVLGVFIVVLILLSIVSNVINEIVRGSGLGMVNRALGLSFGILRGGLVVCLLYIGLQAVEPDETAYPEWIAQAKSLPYVRRGAQWLRSLMPEDVESAAPSQAGLRDGNGPMATDGLKAGAISAPPVYKSVS